MLAVVGEALSEASTTCAIRRASSAERKASRQQEIDRVEELRALVSRVEAVLERFCRLLEVERTQRQSILDLPTPTRSNEVNSLEHPGKTFVTFHLSAISANRAKHHDAVAMRALKPSLGVRAHTASPTSGRLVPLRKVPGSHILLR